MFVGNLAVVEANGMDDYYWEIYHLMGDPSLSTYFGVPETNNVSFDPFMPVGSEAIEIQADPFSYVGISQNGAFLGSGTIDESGFVVIVFNSPVSDPGMLDVIVTAQNKQPYLNLFQNFFLLIERLKNLLKILLAVYFQFGLILVWDLPKLI